MKSFYDHLMQYLVKRQVFHTHWRLIIKFYASMSSLGTTYLKSNIINNVETWRDFITGFNEEYPLCYFIDAGDNQTSVEHKIQDQLGLFFGHRNCQHTVLIGSPDGSYTGFLRQYMRSDHLCGRITVIEAIPFPGEFHDLSSRFLPENKDSLFPVPTDHNSCTPPTSPKTSVRSPKRPTSILPSSSLNPSPRTSPQKSRSSTIPKIQSARTSKEHQSVQLSTQRQQSSPRSSSVPSLLVPGPKTNSKPKPKPSPKPKSQSPTTPICQPHPRPTPTQTPTPLSGSQSQPKTSTASSTSTSSSTIRRKPLAEIQTRLPLPRPRNTFFDSKGQRVDSKAYVSMYTERYLQY